MGRGKVFPASRARSLVNPLRRLVQSSHRTVAALGLAADAKVLEVGSGPGFFSPSLSQAVPNGQLVVLDLQSEMLLLASARLAASRNAQFLQADALRLPFTDACFDAVFIATMLGEVPDVDRCLTDIRRVLRQGGVASFSETRRDSDYLTLDKLTSLVEAHSFEFIDTTGPSWQYLARFRGV